MDLKIAAHEMLAILIDSGIDETDAKAIIFDIIQIQGVESEERKKLIDVRREREVKKKQKHTNSFKTQKYDEEEYVEDTDEGESEESSAKPKRRVNFSTFGGDSPPLK